MLLSQVKVRKKHMIKVLRLEEGPQSQLHWREAFDNPTEYSTDVIRLLRKREKSF